MNAITFAPLFADEAKALAFIESKIWPDGKPICPHCEATESQYSLSNTGKGKTGARLGLRKCGKCRKQYTVRVNTIFEDSHIPLNKWLFAIYLMCSSKKGISANQLKRELGISYRSCWFMCHRIREAMTQQPLAGMLGSGGKIVEVDETFVGGKPGNNMHRNKTKAAGKKTTVLTMIERDGEVRALVVPDRKRGTLLPLINPLIDTNAQIMTDTHGAYDRLRSTFKKHQRVNHSETYVRGIVHTNFAESFFTRS